MTKRDEFVNYIYESKGNGSQSTTVKMVVLTTDNLLKAIGKKTHFFVILLNINEIIYHNCFFNGY